MIDQQLVSEVIESQPFPLLFLTISGAHLYGFPSHDSDYDLRGIHVLPPQKILGLYPVRETIEISEVEAGLEIDLVTHDIKKFFTLLLTRNGYVLEQLYSPLIIKTTPEHRQLRAIASNCITRNHYYHYQGFAKNQWQLFTKKNVYEVKPLLYIYRVLLTGINLMNTGRIEANLVDLNQEFNLSHINDLIELKKAESEKAIFQNTDLTFHQQEYQRLQGELETAFNNSHLPETSSAKPELNNLLLEIRKYSR
ncbi:nucleotidyltransferase domain-containing protein [Waterburya agarophytonicola K14]|uniref:Nucleotidyltransferase domain-containing protein n=1 Tax=Waterburya agarophytonicola KI4 TaxID=2874699 RepID=A0A964BRC6_9CYAN|nr:nucleotidyltransferase domain-containing protein [Waterburya agarophytonicola]MCC0178278.1 nucleotidyltransferase domain-containing protein [Waterburya agarophytonicola KI4]